MCNCVSLFDFPFQIVRVHNQKLQVNLMHAKVAPISRFVQLLLKALTQVRFWYYLVEICNFLKFFRFLLVLVGGVKIVMRSVHMLLKVQVFCIIFDHFM